MKRPLLAKAMQLQRRPQLREKTLLFQALDIAREEGSVAALASL